MPKPSLAELPMGLIVLPQRLAALMWWLSARRGGQHRAGPEHRPWFSHSFTDMMVPGVFILLRLGLARADDSAETLPMRVDAALYRAKAAGRKRVEEAE